MTKEEKPYWDELRARKEVNEEGIAELERILSEKPDYPYRKQVFDDREHAKKMRALFQKVLSD